MAIATHIDTRRRVAALLARGLNVSQVAAALGITKSTACYHKRRLGYRIEDKFNRRYDWAQVQRYYDEGHSISDCQAQFGMARKTFLDAVVRGDVVTRPQATPIDELLVAGRKTHRWHLRRRLIALGLKENRC
ncbi:MAG: helix-turn-helix domain-containing protein, partial [Thermoleophilaceae bacterium]